MMEEVVEASYKNEAIVEMETIENTTMETIESPASRDKKKFYPQRYRPQWEKLPDCVGWLKASTSSVYMGFCIVCRKDVQANKTDLVRHSKCKKHIKNINKNPDLVEDLPNILEYDIEDRDYKVFPGNDDEDEYFVHHEYDIYDSPKEKKKKKSKLSRISMKEELDSSFKTEAVAIPCKRWCCQQPEAPPVYEDAFSTFGRFVADELRAIRNTYIMQKAKVKINICLFQASIGMYNVSDLDDQQRETSTRLQLPDSNEDDMSYFGKHVANELRGVESPHGQKVVKRLIFSILTKASSDGEPEYEIPVPDSPTHEIVYKQSS